MKGLLLKDIYNVKKQWKYMLFVAVVFSVSFGGAGDGMLASMFSFLCTILVLNNLAQDELDQWYLFAATMPVSSRDFVRAKYIFAVFLCALGAVCGLGLTWLVGLIGLGPSDIAYMDDVIPELLGSAAAILFIMALMIPVNLKFGTQKARYIMLGCVAVPFLAVLASNLLKLFPGMYYFGIKITNGPYLAVTAAMFVAASFLLSCALSVRIMEKKEF